MMDIKGKMIPEHTMVIVFNYKFILLINNINFDIYSLKIKLGLNKFFNSSINL